MVEQRLIGTAEKIFSKGQLWMNSRGQEAWSLWVHRTDVDQSSNEYQSFEFVFEVGYGDYPFHSARLFSWRAGERRECLTREEVEQRLIVIGEHEEEEVADAACDAFLESVTWKMSRGRNRSASSSRGGSCSSRRSWT